MVSLIHTVSGLFHPDIHYKSATGAENIPEELTGKLVRKLSYPWRVPGEVIGKVLGLAGSQKAYNYMVEDKETNSIRLVGAQSLVACEALCPECNADKFENTKCGACGNIASILITNLPNEGEDNPNGFYVAQAEDAEFPSNMYVGDWQEWKKNFEDRPWYMNEENGHIISYHNGFNPRTNETRIARWSIKSPKESKPPRCRSR